MSDVKNTRTLNDTDLSSQRMQSHHSHQANQTTHIAQTERENNIFSQDVKERVNMARQGENLDVLVHDSCPMVRREVAMRGYGLDVLSKDEASIVRHAVASTGYYDLSSLKNETSSIVRDMAAEGHFAMKEVLSKHNDKIDKFSEKINKVDSNLDKLNTAKSTHRVRMYAEYDSATNSNRVHLKLDTSKMSTAEFAQHKRDNRGLLHKIDSTFKSENIGLVYAKFQKPLTYGEDGKQHLQSPVTFHSVSIRPPKLLRKAGNALWQQALKEEAGMFRYGDTAKRLLVDPASQAAKLAVLNKLNEAGRDNLAVDITVKGTRTTLAATRVLMDYRKDMLAYKPTQFQNKHDRLAARLDKAKMKGEIAANKAIFNAANDRAKNKFGLNPSAKKDKTSVKSSWMKIYNGADGKNYMAAPGKKRLDKNSMSKEEYKHQKKLNKLEKKEFKANKKAYETVNVKQAYFNSATGKVSIKNVAMVDKSRAKKPKVKKPSSLGSRAALAGLGELRYKAFNEMAQDDNAAVSAAGKGANAAFSEFSKAHSASLQRREKLHEKRLEKARMKAEKSSAKLQTEKSKSTFSDKKKNNKKKSQKKRLQKNRNAEIFKQNMQKAAKKARDEIARKAADFIAGKGKLVALGALGVVIAMIIPMMFLFMLGGGGGGIIDNSAITGVATYTTDRDGLTKFNTEVNEAYWYWMDSINKTMNDIAKDDTEEWLLVLNPCKGGPVTNCPNELAARAQANANNPDYVEDEANVYSLPSGEDANVTRVVKHLYKGEAVVFSNYDIMCLYAYYTVKYRNEEWGNFAEELENYFKTNYIVACKDENGDIVKNETKSVLLDIHYTTNCKITGSKDPVTGQMIPRHNHTTTSEDHYVDTTEILMHYYLYPQNDNCYQNIQDYIANQIKQIGEVDKEGVSEGEKHYAMLMKSMGYHQAVDLPVYFLDVATNTMTPVDWSNSPSVFGSYGEMYDVNEAHKVDGGGYDVEGMSNDMRYKKVTSDSVEICCYNFTQLDVVAGGNGVIKEKTSDTVVVEYPDSKLKITYICKTRDNVTISNGIPTGMTMLGIGAEVKAGEHLFYANGDNDTRYPMVEIKAYDTELKRDINPLLVVRSRVYE